MYQNFSYSSKYGVYYNAKCEHTFFARESSTIPQKIEKNEEKKQDERIKTTSDCCCANDAGSPNTDVFNYTQKQSYCDDYRETFSMGYVWLFTAARMNNTTI